MEGVVPANVRAKRSKMLRGLSVKKRRAFMKINWEVTEQSCLKAKIS
jgi:hypothetical protein